MTKQTEAWDRIITRLRNWQKHPAPAVVVPDGEGGIVFEGLEFGEIHLWSDGDVTVQKARE